MTAKTKFTIYPNFADDKFISNFFTLTQQKLSP